MNELELKFDQFKRRVVIDGTLLSFIIRTYSIDRMLENRINNRIEKMNPCVDKDILTSDTIEVTLGNGHIFNIDCSEIKKSNEFINNFFEVEECEEAFYNKCVVLSNHIKYLTNAIKSEIETLKTKCSKVYFSIEV